jgi:hypothetical protein
LGVESVGDARLSRGGDTMKDCMLDDAGEKKHIMEVKQHRYSAAAIISKLRTTFTKCEGHLKDDIFVTRSGTMILRHCIIAMLICREIPAQRDIEGKTN